MNDTFTIETEETSLRIDKLLAGRYKPRFSRSYFAGLLEDGLVLVNGEKVKKRQHLEEGDQVEIFFAERDEADLTPENIPLDIIFEDEDLLVINKPANMVVHPAPGNWSGTFVNALLYHCHELRGMEGNRPGIVHRLDKDTTGLLVAAKNKESQRRLIALFAERGVYKEYMAIAIGNPSHQTVETLIGRDPKNRQKMAVVEERGKMAVTHIKTLKSRDPFSLVQCIIETGRTHQIRVHLKHIKTPVLGDPVYGSDAFNKKYKIARTLLHAYKLKFKHPMTGEPLEFMAPLPEDIESMVK
jgi:23S rRNA pseudouridine1911/1915/1917 synthase